MLFVYFPTAVGFYIAFSSDPALEDKKMEDKLRQLFGQPDQQSETPRTLHWAHVSAQFGTVTKLFIVGHVYTITDEEWKRQTQNSPYILPEKNAYSFKDLDELLRDLRDRIAPKRKPLPRGRNK